MEQQTNSTDFDIIQLYASIAHEVNNPLTIIDGYAEIVQTLLFRPEIDRAAIEKYLAKMRLTIKRVSKIVNGLKEMAMSSPADPAQDLNLTNIIQDSIKFCDEKIALTNVSIDSIFGQILPISGWSWQLVQVFCNLINNACDAVSSLPIRNISIKLVADDANYVIVIEDSGAGVPEAIRSRIFYPFYTTKSEGTGMGLALSRQFLKNHGGGIALDSTSDHGRFIIKLPKIIKNAAARGINNDPTDFLSPRTGGPIPPVAASALASSMKVPIEKIQARVLIVDDEQEIVDILKIYLSKLIEHITVTSSPLTALELLQQESFDIVITDIVMPIMSGFDLIQAAQKAGFKGQFIIISGSSNQMPEEAIASGVDSVFNKPINFSSLTSRLRFLLGPPDVANTKRRFERIAVDSKVRVRMFFGERELVGKIGDFSRGGFFFSGEPLDLKKGSEVAIRIFYYNHNANRVFDATAIVRWLSDAGAGCQFLQIPEKSLVILEDLVNYVKTNTTV